MSTTKNIILVLFNIVTVNCTFDIGPLGQTCQMNIRYISGEIVCSLPYYPGITAASDIRAAVERLVPDHPNVNLLYGELPLEEGMPRFPIGADIDITCVIARNPLDEIWSQLDEARDRITETIDGYCYIHLKRINDELHLRITYMQLPYIQFLEIPIPLGVKFRVDTFFISWDKCKKRGIRHSNFESESSKQTYHIMLALYKQHCNTFVIRMNPHIHDDFEVRFNLEPRSISINQEFELIRKLLEASLTTE